MNRLAVLTKQIQDAMAEIKEILPVINAGGSNGNLWFQLMEDDFIQQFPSYFRVTFNGDCHHSEVYTTINGVRFLALSPVVMPTEVDRICVASPPERQAV